MQFNYVVHGLARAAKQPASGAGRPTPVMMTPSPNSSYCGRPARPNICITSSGDSSPHAPTSGLYTCQATLVQCAVLQRKG